MDDMKLTLCPHCKTPGNIFLGKVVECSSCNKPFICINAYCASANYDPCRCCNFLERISHAGSQTKLLPTNSSPIYLKADTPINCFQCGLSWGIRDAVINMRDNLSHRPFEGFFVVPLEKCNDLMVYHGTSFSRLESIIEDGLLPPNGLSQKQHGFANELLLRYVGRDIAPAESHAEDNCIIEMTYSGLIAITELPCFGEALNNLINQLPIEVGGIQYFEDGKSIAFRPQANLKIINTPEMPIQKNNSVDDNEKYIWHPSLRILKWIKVMFRVSD